MRHSRTTTRTRRSAGVAASAAATSGTLPKGSRTRISRIVADRNSAAIVEGGASSAGGAVYRRPVAATARDWHNRALRHGPSRSQSMPTNMQRSRRTAAAAVLCVIAIALAHAKPPIAPVKNVSDAYFGTTVNDPYRYMEDMKNAEVADWMKAQADYTRDALAKIPQRDTVLKEVTAFGDAAAARVTSVQITGNNVYYLKRKADENIPKLYAREGFAGNERLLVDPDKLPAPEGKHYAVDRAEIPIVANPIGSKYAIGLVINGVQNEFRLYVAPLAGLAGDKTPWVRIVDNADDVTAFDVAGENLYLLTHRNASRFKVVS